MLTLVIGNKCHSSWSLRPWILMKQFDIPFQEVLIPFADPINSPAWKSEVKKYSPAGKVPALVDGEVAVWESLAIMEYLAETHPDRADLAERPGGARDGAVDRLRDARRLLRHPRRLPDEPRQAVRKRRTAAPASRRMRRGSRRSGARRESASAKAGRSCSAPSAPPTRCTPRW